MNHAVMVQHTIPDVTYELERCRLCFDSCHSRCQVFTRLWRWNEFLLHRGIYSPMRTWPNCEATTSSAHLGKVRRPSKLKRLHVEVRIQLRLGWRACFYLAVKGRS
eukprot:SAG31_NODE_3938_length_3735_cov_3.200220_4_plen_106_part_00